MEVKPKNVEEQHYYIHGCQPTKEDMAFYRRFQSLFGIPESDGLWPAIIAMQGFSTKFYDTPDKMVAEADKFLQKVKAQADAVVRYSADTLKQDLVHTLNGKMDKIAASITEAARQDKGAAHGMRIFWGALTCVTMLGLGAFAGFFQGHMYGGMDATNSGIAAEWGATDIGKKAYALYKRGDLEQILSCSAPGWKIEDEKGAPACYPYEAADGTHGWLLPE